MMQLIPLRGPHHHCACWHRDASGNSRLHRVHHHLTRRAAPGRHREPRGTRWASASLVAPRARPGNQPPSLHPVHPRSPETDVRAAASSPVSHAARRRVETPRTWPPRIAVTDRRTLLAWTCATAGQIHAVITNLASSLQAPASAEVFSMVGKSLITSFRDWYRDGIDVQARLPLLSTWLGHADPKWTYWYYSDSRVIPIPAPLPA